MDFTNASVKSFDYSTSLNNGNIRYLIEYRYMWKSKWITSFFQRVDWHISIHVIFWKNGNIKFGLFHFFLYYKYITFYFKTKIKIEKIKHTGGFKSGAKFMWMKISILFQLFWICLWNTIPVSFTFNHQKFLKSEAEFYCIFNFKIIFFFLYS